MINRTSIKTNLFCASILLCGASAFAQREAAEQGKFEATWESLSQYETPEWFRDAKFGIWAHWGPQCQPEAGDWYGRAMYEEGGKIRKSKNPAKPKRKVQNPAKIRSNHNSKWLLKYKSRNIGLTKKEHRICWASDALFVYKSRNIIKHYIRVMSIIVH